MKKRILILAAVLLLMPVPASAECAPSVYAVSGESMAPAIPPGDHLETLPLDCLDRKIKRGDVVVFSSGAEPRPLVKRVIAVPGDTFSTKGDKLWVNEKRAQTSNGTLYNLPPQRLLMFRLYVDDNAGVIPQGTLLVLGEDPAGTTDSSRFGLVAFEDIKGVMVKNLTAALQKKKR